MSALRRPVPSQARAGVSEWAPLARLCVSWCGLAAPEARGEKATETARQYSRPRGLDDWALTAGDVCLEEEAAVPPDCLPGGEVCDAGGGVGPDGSCSFVVSCPDSTQSMQCEGDTCTCYVDGVEVGSCPAGDICQQGGQLGPFASECCGF